jgi:hypothetical protein
MVSHKWEKITNDIGNPITFESNGITSSLGQSTTTNVYANGHTIDGSWNYTSSKSHNED